MFLLAPKALKFGPPPGPEKKVPKNCLLPIAYCLLPIAHCLLPIAYCLLPIAYCPALCLAGVMPCRRYALPALCLAGVMPFCKMACFCTQKVVCFVIKRRVSAGTQSSQIWSPTRPRKKVLKYCLGMHTASDMHSAAECIRS